MTNWCKHGKTDQVYCEDCKVESLQQKVNTLKSEAIKWQKRTEKAMEALKLAMPIVEHQSPTRATEIKRILAEESPREEQTDGKVL